MKAQTGEPKKERGSNFRQMAQSLACGVLLLSFMVLGASKAAADPVATGNFQVFLDVATGSLAGTTLAWDNQDFFLFGDPVPVNLGVEPGINNMSVAGWVGGITVPGPRPSGPYNGTYSSMTPGVLTFTTFGAYVCPDDTNVCGSAGWPHRASFVGPVVNLWGTMVNQGPGTLPLFVGGAPVEYSADGSSDDCATDGVTTVCTGRVNLNASVAVNTPVGGTPGPADSVSTDVSTNFSFPGSPFPVPVDLTVTYDVVTQAGFTNVVASSEAEGIIDPNFSVDVGGFAAIFLDITTGALVDGPIRICGDYPDVQPPPDGDGIVDGTLVDECALRFLHNEGIPPGEFLDRTLPADHFLCPFLPEETPCDNPDVPGGFLCINTVTNQICAGVTSLSWFVVAVDVRNAPPVIDHLTVTPVPAALGDAVYAEGAFCDPDIGQQHIAEIDWGDGVVGPAQTIGDGCYQVEADHLYAETGIYVVTMTVIDEDGASDSTEFRYAVIYDPSGGFVTGGGWIDSLEGAYSDDLLLTGKANFGFVSKYKKGASVPTGNTEFQFKVADLNFKSTSYDWLVIAGSKAKFKGDGTINGAGNYGFMLTAADSALPGGGESDTFRIKIWDKDNGDVVVYDNQMGAEDDADTTTALGGGSIVITTNERPRFGGVFLCMNGGLRIHSVGRCFVCAIAGLPRRFRQLAAPPAPYAASSS